MTNMNMKTVVVLAVSLWTILSPVHAALPEDCSTDATSCTTADANAECSGGACQCKSAYVYKDDSCVAKGLGNTCAATTDCAAVTNAVCPTPITVSSVCTCDTLYKKDGDACVKLLGSPCSGTVCDVLHQGTCATNCECSSGYRPNADTTDCVKELRPGDCSDGHDADWCAATGVANSVCVGSACECEPAFKIGPETCVRKGLTDACTADTDCKGVTNAVCASSVCACNPLYTGATCDTKLLGSSCTDNADCNALNHGTCDTTCKCNTGYTPNANTIDCVQKLTEKDCTVDNVATACPANAECKELKCACKEGFVEAADTCEVQNGASGMSSQIGLLCVILMLFNCLTKY